MLEFTKKNRNLLLFLTLLGFFFILPFLNESKFSGFILTGFLSLVLIFSIFAAGSTKKASRIAVFLGIIALLAGWWDSPYTQTNASIIISKIAFCLFFVFVAGMLLKRIFHAKKITARTLKKIFDLIEKGDEDAMGNYLYKGMSIHISQYRATGAERYALLYKRRRKQGLCVQCGEKVTKKNPRTGRLYRLCEYHREMIDKNRHNR